MMDYTAELLTEKDFKDFKVVYEDFCARASSDYKFELSPLPFADFTDAVRKNLIQCIILKENDIPSAFLIYTTVISEAIELNIIHSLNLENFVIRSQYLMEEFLKQTEQLRKKQIVCYPMLGAQEEFVSYITHFGFKLIGIAVLRFMMSGTNSIQILQNTKQKELPDGYIIKSWRDKYLNSAVNIVQEAFETTSDALFDPRFKTLDGTFDILTKIIKNIYAEFLPEATSVLLYNGNPVGFCFMNLTDGKIANIPIVAIKEEHQGLGLSQILLKNSIEKIISGIEAAKYPITEINTCTETDNYPALKMYRNSGFKEDYWYTQAYLPIKNG